MVTANIAAVDVYGAVALDYLTDTGEIAWIELNSDLPAGMPAGPMPQANVVKLGDKTGNPPRTIYYTGDDVIGDVQFIDGGQRLAIQLIPQFDGVNPPTQGVPIKWIALDRQGQVTDLEIQMDAYPRDSQRP